MEDLRELMHKCIEVLGTDHEATVLVSQELDKYIVKSMKGECKNDK